MKVNAYNKLKVLVHNDIPSTIPLEDVNQSFGKPGQSFGFFLVEKWRLFLVILYP